MTVYCAFTQHHEAFSKDIHTRHDVHVLSLHIQQREGELALLRMRVTPKEDVRASLLSLLSERGHHCVVSYHHLDDDPVRAIFQGTLCHIPTKNADGSWTLEYRASVEKGALDHAIHAYTPSTDHASFFQELAPAPLEVPMFQTTCKLFEHDRENGHIVVSDFMTGQDVITPHAVLKESVRIRFGEIPYTDIHLTLCAKWTQKDDGEVNIGPALEAAFPEGIINTLTPKHFETTFPHAGTRLLGHEGLEGLFAEAQESQGESFDAFSTHIEMTPQATAYYVVESSLLRIDPPSTGILDVYPTHTGSFYLQKAHTVVATQWPRTWFRCRLFVSWRYRQKRKEVIHIPIQNQMASMAGRPTKHIQLNVDGRVIQKACDAHGSSLSSFFKTTMGKDAIQYALDYAQCFLISSQRCVDVSFKVPFFEGLDLSTHKAVDVTDILRTPYRVLAKITDYQLVHEGPHGYAHVHASLFMGGMGGVSVSQSDAIRTNREMYIQDIQERLQPQGIVDTSPFHTLSVVEGIRVMHDGRSQSQELMEAMAPTPMIIEDEDSTQDADALPYPTLNDLKGFLKDHPTRFSIQLKHLEQTSLCEDRVDASTFLYSPLDILSDALSKDKNGDNTRFILSMEDMHHAI